MILLASSPDRLVTVKCATDCRCRVFCLASTEISVICIATRGALRSTIVIFLSFSLAKVSTSMDIGCLRHSYSHVKYGDSINDGYSLWRSHVRHIGNMAKTKQK